MQENLIKIQKNDFNSTFYYAKSNKLLTMNTTIRCQSTLVTMKTTFTDTSKYKTLSKNNKLVKETVKSMRKAIYNANSINQMTNPLEYKSAWNNVFIWSTELRKTIDTCNNDLAKELMNNDTTKKFSGITATENDLE